jgi:hypothetical protein
MFVKNKISETAYLWDCRMGASEVVIRKALTCSSGKQRAEGSHLGKEIESSIGPWVRTLGSNPRAGVQPIEDGPGVDGAVERSGGAARNGQPGRRQIRPGLAECTV